MRDGGSVDEKAGHLIQFKLGNFQLLDILIFSGGRTSFDSLTETFRISETKKKSVRMAQSPKQIESHRNSSMKRFTFKCEIEVVKKIKN